MITCYISHQIANHCNQEESFCPACGENMYFDEFDSGKLVCASEYCDEEISLEQDD